MSLYSDMLKAFGFGTPKRCSVLSVPVGGIPLSEENMQPKRLRKLTAALL